MSQRDEEPTPPEEQEDERAEKLRGFDNSGVSEHTQHGEGFRNSVGESKGNDEGDEKTGGAEEGSESLEDESDIDVELGADEETFGGYRLSELERMDKSELKEAASEFDDGELLDVPNDLFADFDMKENPLNSNVNVFSPLELRNDLDQKYKMMDAQLSGSRGSVSILKNDFYRAVMRVGLQNMDDVYEDLGVEEHMD